MSFEQIQKIPTVKEVLAEMPLNPKLIAEKKERDAEIRKIFEGKSDKFFLVVGPCSADNEDAVCDYVSRLRKAYDKIKSKVVLVPRIYTNKPRTTGEGYKGMAHQPDPKDKPNIVKGIMAIRKMHIRVMSESGFSAADEMLYPGNYPYVEDLLSYVAVGARSVENQQHRLTASGLDIPVGMKNPTGGDLNVMLNAVNAAQMPHQFIYAGNEVLTSGNPLAHTILRGAVNQYGQHVPNYHYEDMAQLMALYTERKLVNPAILVDCNHSNSGKKFREQPRIAKEVLAARKHSEALKKGIKGLMIESYIVEGTQNVADGVYGKSITDPCLGWEATEKLLQELADLV